MNTLAADEQWSTETVIDTDETLWASQQVAEIPAVDGYDNLLALSDETILYWAKFRHQTMTILRIDPQNGRVDYVQCPLPEPSWMIRASTDWILVAQAADAERELEGCFVLWNPVTQSTQNVEGEAPDAATMATDRLGDHIHIVTNDRFSGASAGFDYVIDQTNYGIFDIKTGQFSTPFHSVEDTEARHLIVHNKNETLVFGYGRANYFIDLMRRDFSHVDRSKHDFEFRLSHGYDVECLGADSQRALLVFGNYGYTDPKEYALMRWTRDQACFEVIGRWIGMRYLCSTILNDGSSLIFCRQRTTGTVRMISHVPGKYAAYMGRLEGMTPRAVFQSARGDIYVKSAKSLHRITAPESTL